MDVQTLLLQAVPEFKPFEKVSVSQWAESYFELPETSAEPGKWNRNRAAYQAGILDALNEPGVNKITLMTSAQIGKTILCLIVICYLIDLDPCSIMLTQPTIQMAEKFSKEKLASVLGSVKPVSEKINNKTRSSASTILMKMFVGGFLSLGGANSPASLASMSIRVFLGDEVDKYPPSAGKEGDPVDLAIERTSTFWNSLIFLVSTPNLKNASRIETSFNESDQRHYFVPCPHCGHKQHLVWERVEYEGKGTDDPNPLSGVYYICEKCDRPIEESAKTQMIRDGEWRSTAKSKDPGHAGFHLNRLYSPWVKWSDMALYYEVARNDPQRMQVFVNAHLGLPYEAIAGEKLDWERLRSRPSDYYQQTVPEGGLILTAGVDVQKDRLEVAIWAWGRGEEAWLIRYEKILGSPLSDEVWEQLAVVTTKSYSGLRVRATAIDTGYLTQDVYHQIRRKPSLHWFAIKGYSGNGKPIISSPSQQDINHNGKKIKGGIKLYKVGVDLAKETLYSRSAIAFPGPKYLHFPRDLEEGFFEGFCSEIQSLKERNGIPYYVWQKLPGVRNEALDISVYALAAAYLVGVNRVRWSHPFPADDRQGLRVTDGEIERERKISPKSPHLSKSLLKGETSEVSPKRGSLEVEGKRPERIPQPRRRRGKGSGLSAMFV